MSLEGANESPFTARIVCDPSADAAYLHVRPDLTISRTQICGNLINLDWSVDGILIGIEFMRVPELIGISDVLPRKYQVKVPTGCTTVVTHNLRTVNIEASARIDGQFVFQSSYMVIDLNSISVTVGPHTEQWATITVLA